MCVVKLFIQPILSIFPGSKAFIFSTCETLNLYGCALLTIPGGIYPWLPAGYHGIEVFLSHRKLPSNGQPALKGLEMIDAILIMRDAEGNSSTR